MDPTAAWALGSLRLGTCPDDACNQVGFGHRSSEQVALQGIALSIREDHPLFLDLDPFCNHAQVEFVREPDHAFDEAAVGRVVANPAHERTINLDRGRTEMPEVGEGGLPRSEVIERDRDSHPFQSLDDSSDCRGIIHRCSFGDLELERARRKPMTGQYSPNLVEQFVANLGRGDIHRNGQRLTELLSDPSGAGEVADEPIRHVWSLARLAPGGSSVDYVSRTAFRGRSVSGLSASLRGSDQDRGRPPAWLIGREEAHPSLTHNSRPSIDLPQLTRSRSWASRYDPAIERRPNGFESNLSVTERDASKSRAHQPKADAVHRAFGDRTSDFTRRASGGGQPPDRSGGGQDVHRSNGTGGRAA